jgi:aryl-alcohol dehydrogenase-like predicted oxidoreductase
MIPLCRHEGVGLIPWSPLGRGLLTRPRPAEAQVKHATTARSSSDEYSPTLYGTEGDWKVVDAVERVAKARGVPMAQVALAWLLSRPGVVAPIVGATKMGHLNDAIAALDLTLTADEVASLEAPYQPHGVKGHSV